MNVYIRISCFYRTVNWFNNAITKLDQQDVILTIISLSTHSMYTCTLLEGGRGVESGPPPPRKIQTSWTNIIKLPNLSLRSPLAKSNIPWSPWKKFWTRAYYGIKLFIFITVAPKRRNSNNCSNDSKVLFQENSVKLGS